MSALLGLALVFGGLWLIAMGRETWRRRQSGSWDAMAQARTEPAAVYVVAGASALVVAAWLVS